MKLETEDFAEWRENPITLAVFQVLRAKIDEAKAKWVSYSWDNGGVASEVLMDLRISAEAWQYVIDMDVEEIEGVLDGEDK